MDDINKLETLFNSIISTIKNENSLLLSLREELNKKETAIEKEEDRIEKERKTLEKKISEAGGIDAAVKAKDEYSGKTAEVNSRMAELNRKHGDLIDWENKLFLMDKRLTESEANLAKRQSEQETRETNYKEKLRQEFLETLKRQLPQ